MCSLLALLDATERCPTKASTLVAAASAVATASWEIFTMVADEINEIDSVLFCPLHWLCLGKGQSAWGKDSSSVNPLEVIST